MATLVDTNVLIDVTVRDPNWGSWARRALTEVRREGPLVINQVIFAEFSTRYSSPDEVDMLLPGDEFVRESLPWRAAFAAGVAFRRYRAQGGVRDRVLPDFLIGAHAVISGYSVLTRDSSGYRKYFPTISLITPETHP